MNDESDKIPEINANEVKQEQHIKFRHKKWKALLKKQKRKIKRQNEAQSRDEQAEEENLQKEQSARYQAEERRKKQIEELEKQREQAEKAYFNKLWMEKERIAQEEFERKKKWEEKEKIKKEAIEKKIREEWEERQQKEKEEEEREEKKKKHQDSLLHQATANENKGGEEPWHNPIASLLPGKEKETCPFFAKTGACRFGERCSRGHPQPESTTTILMRGMYSHFELEQGLLEENDTDLILEYEDGELYNNFREFYDDIVPEFKAVGRVIQVKVCCNYEPHLRGNVYIQYESEEEAHSAMVKMNGRFYGGKQISCEPVLIKSWKYAICGLFGRGKCPKGRNCNFIHAFKNPRNEFWEYDKPKYTYKNYHRHESSKRSRSRSPYRGTSHQRYYSRDRTPDKYKSRNRYRSRSHRYSRSRSRERYSRSRSRDRSRSQSRRKSRERSTVSYSKRSRCSRSRSKDRYQYRRSRSKDRSKSYSSSSSDSRSSSKKHKKKKKHKKQKKKSKSEKVNNVSNGETNNVKDNITTIEEHNLSDTVDVDEKK